MFKSYLQYQSKSFQLGVFLFMWAALYLISIFFQVFFIPEFFHINKDQLQEFAITSITQHPDFVITSNAVYSFLVLGLPAFLFAYLATPSPTRYLGLYPSKNPKQWKWIVPLAIGLIPVISTISGLIRELNLGSVAQKLQTMRDAQINAYLKNANGWDLLQNILFLAVLPAFFEELFFRGIIQRFAFSYWKSAWGAIFISALTFALMHMSLYEFLPIFLAGLALAWIYQHTGCLWLNVAVHLLFNGLQVVIAYYAAHTDAFNAAGNNHLYIGIATLVGLLLLYFSFKKLSLLRTPFPKSWGVEEKGNENENYL